MSRIDYHSQAPPTLDVAASAQPPASSLGAASGRAAPSSRMWANPFAALADDAGDDSAAGQLHWDPEAAAAKGGRVRAAVQGIEAKGAAQGQPGGRRKRRLSSAAAAEQGSRRVAPVLGGFQRSSSGGWGGDAGPVARAVAGAGGGAEPMSPATPAAGGAQPKASTTPAASSLAALLRRTKPQAAQQAAQQSPKRRKKKRQQDEYLPPAASAATLRLGRTTSSPDGVDTLEFTFAPPRPIDDSAPLPHPTPPTA